MIPYYFGNVNPIMTGWQLDITVVKDRIKQLASPFGGDAGGH